MWLTVIRKANGMNFEDILEAQAKLDVEKASVVKEKPSRKGKKLCRQWKKYAEAS